MHRYDRIIILLRLWNNEEKFKPKWNQPTALRILGPCDCTQRYTKIVQEEISKMRSFLWIKLLNNIVCHCNQIVNFCGEPRYWIKFGYFLCVSCVSSSEAKTINQPKFDPSTLEKNNQRRTEVYVIQQSANVLQTHKQLQAKVNYARACKK